MTCHVRGKACLSPSVKQLSHEMNILSHKNMNQMNPELSSCCRHERSSSVMNCADSNMGFTLFSKYA